MRKIQMAKICLGMKNPLLAEGIWSGIAEELEAAPDDMTRLRWAQQVKKLTLPHEMGELFKVLAFSRKVDEALSGFAWRDMRDRL